MPERMTDAVFGLETPVSLDAEQAALKRQIYEQMAPRRRKFVDRIGYENWDPFQEPNHPMDMRVDVTRRTARQLVNAFSRDRAESAQDAAYRKGVMECAVGVVTRDEKFRGIFDFCLWYRDLLKKEGRFP